MSAFSTVELELVQDGVSIESIVNVLIKGCWMEESDDQSIISTEYLEFSGGLYDSHFKISLVKRQLVIESDSPWELEVLIEELKDIAIKKPRLVNI